MALYMARTEIHTLYIIHSSKVSMLKEDIMCLSNHIKVTGVISMLVT